MTGKPKQNTQDSQKNQKQKNISKDKPMYMGHTADSRYPDREKVDKNTHLLSKKHAEKGRHS